jgi:drug/metabolite transporter (DMT)-like permease
MGVWVTSLFFTSVASSIILVSTQSVFAVLISHFGIKERVSRGIMLAVIIAVIGSAIITGGDLRIGRDTMVGDILALTGGLMAALYMIAGRKIRQELPLLPYIFVAYSTAALLLGIGCLVFRTQMWGYPGQTYLWLILLALIPTHLGHTMFNWALKYLPAYVIGISLLGEPIGSTILAVLVFSEIPPAMTFAGGTLVLAGLYMLAREERGARKKADPGSWMLEAGK